ncbi:helix-turn-helix transcriptional regulator [Agrobacterium sp.]|uniref:helix-turn-helix domain-containing protein n=1 Tax=Agrobacterium sp. TaxID=361 RepID=UPI0028AF3294|nr:helix-turn-helix transcriptional regulator [Agrobacterium sp.]
MAEIDGEWFHNRLKDTGKSLRALARHLDSDPSAVSRTFSGSRKMKMEEAVQIAIFLGVSVSDVIKHAGITTDADAIQARILLAATIDESGTLQMLPEPRPLPQPIIEKAQLAAGGHYNRQIIAAQIRASSGSLAIWDDAVVLFSQTEGVDPAAIGALSVCGLRDGKQILARVERARKTGEADLVSPQGKIEDANLATATPIIVLLP